MADGAYQDLRGPDPWHPGRICQMWAWPSPTWQCSTSTTSPASQPRTTAGNTERPLRRPIENNECRMAERQQPRHQDWDSSYLDFLATHPLVFADATDPLEADNWLHTTESKFGLLHYTEIQKTLYAAQHLRGSAGAWWASYTTTLPADHHIPLGKFYTAFCAHHLSVGLLHNKLKEFLDLK
jgi:hypothetical protein